MIQVNPQNKKTIDNSLSLIKNLYKIKDDKLMKDIEYHLYSAFRHGYMEGSKNIMFEWINSDKMKDKDD